LVHKMAEANPFWGAPRIHGELLKLAIELPERSVSRLMPKSRKPPSQTWRAFHHNRVEQLVSIDFFTVPSATFRVLFVLVVLAHHRRRVIFWRGGVDTQKTLPFGTVEDVGREVSSRLRALDKGGGYVSNSTHNVQARVPIENVLAMYETVRECGKYRCAVRA